MLIVKRRHLAANLAAYGEHEASARIESMSAEDLTPPRRDNSPIRA
jgi:hypothetical protein